MRGVRSFIAAMLISICSPHQASGAAEQPDRLVLTLGQAVSDALGRNDRMINGGSRRRRTWPSSNLLSGRQWVS